MAPFLAFALSGVLALFPQAATDRSASDWDALVGEYDKAFQSWASELERTGGWQKPEAERPPSPALAFWPRFEALADLGEGRATLWLLANLQLGHGPAVLARVKRGGDAEWVGTAFYALGGNAGAFDGDELRAYLEERAAKAGPEFLRAYAALALAEVVKSEDPGHARHLRLWSALLVHQHVDLAPGEPLAREDALELGALVVDRVEKESREHFALAYREGPDGNYYPVSAAPPDPEGRWRPVIEELAALGSTRARLWSLEQAPWALDAAGKERLRGFLEAVASEPLSEEELRTLGGQIGSLVYRLGLAAVEPSVRKLIESSPDELRPGLLFGLGAAVCETALDDAAQRERGLGILREVLARWPTSEEATDAEGRIFRFTNLVVGKKVPDFEAVDADGNAFKLSDYAGKVTVIDFWGFW